MITTSTTIDAYLDAFERWIGGNASVRAELRRELEAHLQEAAEAGDLDGALRRLGPPRDAARSFCRSRTLTPATRQSRIHGFVYDFFIGFILIVGPPSALNLIAFDSTGEELNGAAWCRNLECALTGWAEFVVFSLGIASLFYWIVLLTLLEWRYGRTPGKVVRRTRVVAEDGTALDLGQAVIRRLPLVFSGPLQIIDWLFALRRPKHQRAFEIIARTQVIDDR